MGRQAGPASAHQQEKLKKKKNGKKKKNPTNDPQLEKGNQCLGGMPLAIESLLPPQPDTTALQSALPVSPGLPDISCAKPCCRLLSRATALQTVSHTGILGTGRKEGISAKKKIKI